MVLYIFYIPVCIFPFVEASRILRILRTLNVYRDAHFFFACLFLLAEGVYFLFFNLFQCMCCVSSQYRALVRHEFLGFQGDKKICFHFSEQRKNCKRFE